MAQKKVAKADAKKVGYEFKDGALLLNGDFNKDGESSVTLKLHMSETVKEALRQGKAIEGQKVATLEFKGTDLVFKIDSNKDGVPALEGTVHLAEVVDETGVLK